MKFLFDTCTSLDANFIKTRGVSLISYIHTLRTVAEAGGYSAPESSINLSDDVDMVVQVETLAASLRTPDLKYIFVIGIGGSNLGTKAIYDALYAARDSVPHTATRLLFVDTNDAAQLTAYRDVIWSCTHPSECMLLSISKSGGTTETLANTEILLSVFRLKWKVDTERLVVIADAESPYGVAARAQGIQTLTLPTLVGGRYSVLSAVGLFPLALLGLPVAELHRGAQMTRQFCLNVDMSINPAAQSAVILATEYERGKTIHDTFVIGGRFESLGKWYRQLLGESVGKEKSVAGEIVAVGITPTVSVGSTDLHSVGQLYLGGPRDKVTTFIYDSMSASEPKVPTERTFGTLVPMITGKSVDEISAAILAGTKHAYNGRGLPFMEITFDGVTLLELGSFLQFKMIEVMYLGHLLGVNPFDQPAVELYKIETKRLLEEKK